MLFQASDQPKKVSTRRSRMRRTSLGRKIELTGRDLKLFELLNRYRFLRSTYLYAFLGGNSETRFKERLGLLYHDGRYINRPKQQWQLANCRHMPVVYELDERGEEALREQDLLDNNASPLLSKGRTGAYRQFAHQLMICECLAAIELGVRQNAALRFIPWQEIIAKASERTRALRNPFELPVSVSYTCPRFGHRYDGEIKIVPDGLFGLEYCFDNQRSYRFFALEADRNTMPVRRSSLEQTSWLRKILGYQKIIAGNVHKAHLGIPNLFVLTVTTTSSHMGEIIALVESLTADRKHRLFLFKASSGAMPAVEATDRWSYLLKEPWNRAGYGPIDISKP